MAETLLTRLLDATKLSRGELRKLLKLSEAEMKRMEGVGASRLPAMMDEVFWSELMELVDYRIGLFLAIKAELNKKLESDRLAKLMRRAATRER